jgi:hypothetical protein
MQEHNMDEDKEMKLAVISALMKKLAGEDFKGKFNAPKKPIMEIEKVSMQKMPMKGHMDMDGDEHGITPADEHDHIGMMGHHEPDGDEMMERPMETTHEMNEDEDEDGNMTSSHSMR